MIVPFTRNARTINMLCVALKSIGSLLYVRLTDKIISPGRAGLCGIMVNKRPIVHGRGEPVFILPTIISFVFSDDVRRLEQEYDLIMKLCFYLYIKLSMNG